MRICAPPRIQVSLWIALVGTLAPVPANAALWNKVYSGFASPVEITQAQDGSGRQFVVEQGGKIRIIKNGVVLPKPFIDLGASGSNVISPPNGEQGLLGLAFHPQYATNRQFYVNYTRKPDGATIIERYTAMAGTPDVADPASASGLLFVAQPEGNHNGGAVKFGSDGYLYIGMGDGGGANDQHGAIGNGQDKNSLLGKILRIDVNHGNPYAIPPGNPYAVSGGQKEIFAVGVRNPFRMSFDRATGDFWFGDVGQGAVEEVDMLPAGTGAGANLGWRIMEGNSCTGLASPPFPCGSPALTPPIITYTHAAGDCSVTGGYVYRGAGVPSLVGQYVYADFCTGRIWAARKVGAGPWTPAELGVTGYNISSFGEDEAGELFFVNYANGDIYQFGGSGAPPTLSVSASSLTFGDIVVGSSSATRTFNITNAGGGTLTLTALSPGGLNPGDFTRTGTCSNGATLTASQSCTVVYQFTPAQVGSRSASLAIVTNAGSASVTLDGTGGTGATDVVTVVEYYNAGFDHYFITSLSEEIAALDAGRFLGWTRTQKSFKAWSSRHAGTSAVCRFYIPPSLGDSHFFTASPVECNDARVRFPTFVFESPAVMYEFLPDTDSGTCPANTVPIYRVWNQRVDSNHRYIPDRAVRDAMVARGYVAEGYGPDAVAMCGAS